MDSKIYVYTPRQTNRSNAPNLFRISLLRSFLKDNIKKCNDKNKMKWYPSSQVPNSACVHIKCTPLLQKRRFLNAFSPHSKCLESKSPNIVVSTFLLLWTGMLKCQCSVYTYVNKWRTRCRCKEATEGERRVALIQVHFFFPHAI